MSSPEMPFFLTLLLFPVFTLMPHPTLIPAVLILLSLLSFIRKLALGNRILHIGIYDLVVFLLGAVLLLSGILHGERVSTADGVIFCVFLFAFPLAGNLITNRRLADCALGAVAYPSLPVAVYAIVQVFIGVPNGNWTDLSSSDLLSDRVFATFDNPNVYAVYLLCAFLFCLALAIEKKQPWKKTLYFFGTMLNAAALICTWSRGAWIALGVTLVCVIVMLSRRRSGAFSLLLCTLPYALLLLPSEIPERLLSVFNRADSSILYRLSIYRSSLAMAKDNFLLGIGIGQDNFASFFALYAEEGVTAPHSHDLLLQVLCEGGIVALSLFVCLILLRFVHLSVYRKYIYSSTVLYPAVFSLAAWMAILLFGIADYPFAYPAIAVLFFATYGIGGATLRIAKEEYTDRLLTGDAGHTAFSSSVDIEME